MIIDDTSTFNQRNKNNKYEFLEMHDISIFYNSNINH